MGLWREGLCCVGLWCVGMWSAGPWCEGLCYVGLRCTGACCVGFGVCCCAEGAVTRRQWPGCFPTGISKREGCVCCVRVVCNCADVARKEREPGEPGREPPGDCLHSESCRCTPSLSACKCRRSSYNTHAIVLPRPRRAFSNVARTLAWPYETHMDSLMTWCMNSVPGAWGPVHSMCARCIWGVRKAPAHYSSTAGSQCWWSTRAARVPTFRLSHALSRRRAGSHSGNWAEQAQRWSAVPGCAPRRRHVVSSIVSPWEDQWARTVIVRMLSMRCAVMWRCWSLSTQSRGSPPPNM